MAACTLLLHVLVTSRLDYINDLLCGAQDYVLVTLRLDYSNDLLCHARDYVIKQLERVQ